MKRRLAHSVGVLVGVGVVVLASLSCQPNGEITTGGGELGVSKDRYTILLLTLTGPDHVQLADFHLRRAKQFTGWSGLYVVNQDDHSELFWGRYPTPAAAGKNLQIAKRYVAPATQQHIYRMATIVPLPGEDIGPPEWNLKNAEGEYSYQIAVFYDIPEKQYIGRQKFAVDYCRRLREKGYEAYYCHGPHNSLVTIGTFPRTAIRTEQVAVVHPKTGDRFFRERNVIADPKMRQMQKDFPHMQVCGAGEVRSVYNPQTQKMDRLLTETGPVRIPQK